MEPKVTPIAATLGAVVTDLELARMDAATWKAVEGALPSSTPLLVFPGQHLTEAEQVAFANRFGEPRAPGGGPRAEGGGHQQPEARWRGN